MKINLIFCAVAASTSAAGDADVPGLKQLRGLNIKGGVAQVREALDGKVRVLTRCAASEGK